MKHKKFFIKRLVILFLALLFTINVINLNLINSSGESNSSAEIHTSAEESFQEQWIENPYFTSTDNWTSSKGLLGDPNDINAYIGGGNANYEVLGDQRTFSLVETPPIGSNWVAVPNPEFPQGPSSNFTDSEGLKVYHEFDDHDANQNPSVHWDRNFTMPVNMSDYVITSASIQAVVNATVDEDVDCPGDTIAIDAGNLLNQQESYDYVRFYVLISDLPKDKVYEMAYLQPSDLGAGNPPGDDTLLDTDLIPNLQENLIFYLTSVLSTDFFNFTLTLGIRIYTADNTDTYDNDEFHEVLIKSVNLTFTYEKSINSQTSVSWNQIGNKISDSITISNYTSFEVTEATLFFEYKINDTWPSSSPNSEIRIIMNDIIHAETIKLSTAATDFQNASQDGFDLTSLISDDVNLSIQVFLADEFELDRVIAVSIDNVILNISYTVEFADYQTTLQMLLNGDNQTSITLHKGQMLNITVKYTNQTGGHIPGANIQLTGEGIIETLNETTNQYTIIINVSQELSLEKWNSLNIEATKPNYQTKSIIPSIYVRKLWGEIITLSGEETFDIASGDPFLLRVILNDTDNDELIEGATVQYTLDPGDPIPRVLTEDVYMGSVVYEGLVQYDGGNLPDGLYTITIKVVGGVGDDYDFEHFHPPDGEYTITLNVGGYVPSPEPDLSWLIYLLIFGLSGAIIGFATIFSLYIKYWRFPPLVRKIRALRKKVSKTKKTKPVMVNKREEIIKNNLQDSVKILSLELIQPEKIDKIEKINLEKEEVN